jgi:hypothetical protein
MRLGGRRGAQNAHRTHQVGRRENSRLVKRLLLTRWFEKIATAEGSRCVDNCVQIRCAAELARTVGIHRFRGLDSMVF